MEYIAHRINTAKELKDLPGEYGVELDLRDNLDGSIYICHNPFEPGEDFEEYLKNYHHGRMILNVKSERIEHKCLELMKKYGIEKYFFLDSTFPMIFLLSRDGEKNIALRVSELEGLDTVRNMQGRVEWIWVDCFTKIPIGKEEYRELKAMGYKLCFVSPELEGRDEDIEAYAAYLKENEMEMDAICTKVYNIERWKKGLL
ncbi:MAG: hypothetical protein J6O71_06495 [Lachnospiraceae bacterium]|nr:hypothetical protein [Lachnospiraceae bacterium]